jgi:hypothetical protein
VSTPWNSIAESTIPLNQIGPLKHSVARESPCADCSTSPCCTHLPLNSFRVTNLVELDHALYLLNFDHIELAISSSGEWSAYYAYPCRFLNRSTFECTVHDTPQQPQICVHYNPFNCWYRRSFSGGESDEIVRIDRGRMELLVEAIEFDEDRRITSVPAWEAIVEMMQQFEDRPLAQSVEPAPSDATLDAWAEMVLSSDTSTNGSEGSLARLSFDELADPCGGCEAYCCTTLVFPQAVPGHVSNLDFFRFCLGFPGIELGVADNQWSIIVRTKCRHLSEGRCAVFDDDCRPLICTYYDAWSCSYKPQFGVARPDSQMRVRLDQFDWLVRCLAYTDDGAIVEMPAMEELRKSIEGQWREVGALELIPLVAAD